MRVENIPSYNLLELELDDLRVIYEALANAEGYDWKGPDETNFHGRRKSMALKLYDVIY